MSRRVVYRKGVAPKGVEEVNEYSSSSEEESEQQEEQAEATHSSEKVVLEDRRLQRLQSTAKTSSSTGRIIDRATVEDEAQVEDEETRRARIRTLALEKRRANNATTTSILPEKKEVKVSEEEESSEEEDSSDDQDEFPKRVLFKPVFVSKTARDTILANEQLEAKKRLEEEVKLQQEISRKEEASDHVIDALRKEALEAEHHLAAIDLDDTDGLNEEEEMSAWKIRELLRIKRDREQREYRLVDTEDIERRRNMSDSQIERENKEDGKLGVEKTKLKFMQKYYHKGAFYAGDEAVEEALKRTDTSAPTLEDHQDKLVLPDIMKVKNFGKAGRTKYTHLVDQDTTGMDTAWAKAENTSQCVFKRMGGMKSTFEKPGKKRKTD